MTTNNHIKRIDTPADIAQSANGETAYVVIKTRIKNKHALAFSRLGTLASMISSLSEDDTGPETMRLIGELDKAIERTYKTYAALVTDWNWVDDETGEPLPKPHDNPDIFKEELYPWQTEWIRQQVQSLIRYRSTEGNVSSGNASQIGQQATGGSHRTG